MTTTTLTCVYSMTAVGAVPVATMATRFAAIPIDLALPAKVGLLYSADSIMTVGQVVTRTITLRARPSASMTGTATRFPGDTSGSPLASLVLGAAGADYAAPPIVGLLDGTPNQPGLAVARMGVGKGIVIKGGSGYVTPLITFVGGELAPGGTVATATITQIAGVLQIPTITAPGGPYQVPPTAVVTDTGGGTGGVISAALKGTSLVLEAAGFGYVTAPVPTFTPFFASCCGDAFPASQIAMVRNWMTEVFHATLRTPIIATEPVIA